MAYLITDVNILDGAGREPFRGTIRVEANRIAEVIAGANGPDAAGATVIQGRGATLMPGLIESHAHLGLADMSSQDLNRLPIEEQMLITVRNAWTMLDCGYTSAFLRGVGEAASRDSAGQKRTSPTPSAIALTRPRTRGARCSVSSAAT
jgi:imidazolonepropionase-like amidohydrolase